MRSKRSGPAHAPEHGGNCFVVAGSTLKVQPAGYMSGFAKKQGLCDYHYPVEVPLDDMCDVLVREKTGKSLQKILDKVMKIKPGRV
jgi:NAD-dependent SIR2 family protein deacetylase